MATPPTHHYRNTHYLVFFAAGAQFGLRAEEIRGRARWVGRWLGGLFVLTGVTYVGLMVGAVAYRLSTPGVLLTILWSAYSLAAGAFLFTVAARRTTPPLTGLGRHSFGIYLSHPIILVAADRALVAAGVPSTSLRFLIEWSVTLGGAALLTRLAHRFRPGRLVFGR